jgi:hypothetical protein
MTPAPALVSLFTSAAAERKSPKHLSSNPSQNNVQKGPPCSLVAAVSMTGQKDKKQHDSRTLSPNASIIDNKIERSDVKIVKHEYTFKCIHKRLFSFMYEGKRVPLAIHHIANSKVNDNLPRFLTSAIRSLHSRGFHRSP